MQPQKRSVEHASLPTQVVSIIADVLKEHGISDNLLLEGTTLMPSALRHQTTYVRYEQLLRILENALNLYPKPGLGLEVGRREHVASWGLLGFAVMTVADLRAVLEIGNRYYLSGPALYDLHSYIEGNDSIIQVVTPRPIGRLLPVVVEELFATVCTVFPELIGEPFRVKELQVTYDRPAYSHLYDEFFQCPVRYNAPANHLVFDSAYLDKPLVNANPVSALLSQQLCEQALQNHAHEADLCHTIKLILLRKPDRFPNMEAVADELQMSPRTLRRRLSAEETSYQTLVDEVRRDLAIGYLRDTRLSLAEVAERIGFTEYGNFRKAFRRWTGHAPSHYRNDDTVEDRG
ncbi:AraC family transcriptional regulator [Marinobacterium nitratireducens]|uniref:AraC family transcriptional regulator n=1 Tax=Marinobacterium nitratireducens TaxID=518897 RepID=A0A917ZA13_9GAMM|nr:AraC family transcriptional regulator [Marinobacterium nitratireducens]GGO79315.1 AraC family transcriptional regulator [Marinobacterium nitratireducens]